MELINFSLVNDIIGINTDSGVYLDLHNNYNLSAYNYNFVNRQLLLIWDKAEGNWVKDKDPSAFILSFNKVKIFRVKEADNYEDDDSLNKSELGISMIGFTTENDNEFKSILESPDFENNIIPMTFLMENGSGIIVYSDSVEIELLD